MSAAARESSAWSDAGERQRMASLICELTDREHAAQQAAEETKHEVEALRAECVKLRGLNAATQKEMLAIAAAVSEAEAELVRQHELAAASIAAAEQRAQVAEAAAAAAIAALERAEAERRQMRDSEAAATRRAEAAHMQLAESVSQEAQLACSLSAAQQRVAQLEAALLERDEQLMNAQEAQARVEEDLRCAREAHAVYTARCQADAAQAQAAAVASACEALRSSLQANADNAQAALGQQLARTVAELDAARAVARSEEVIPRKLEAAGQLITAREAEIEQLRTDLNTALETLAESETRVAELERLLEAEAGARVEHSGLRAANKLASALAHDTRGSAQLEDAGSMEDEGLVVQVTSASVCEHSSETVHHCDGGAVDEAHSMSSNLQPLPHSLLQPSPVAPKALHVMDSTAASSFGGLVQTAVAPVDVTATRNVVSPHHVHAAETVARPAVPVSIPQITPPRTPSPLPELLVYQPPTTASASTVATLHSVGDGMAATDARGAAAHPATAAALRDGLEAAQRGPLLPLHERLALSGERSATAGGSVDVGTLRTVTEIAEASFPDAQSPSPTSAQARTLCAGEGVSASAVYVDLPPDLEASLLAERDGALALAARVGTHMQVLADQCTNLSSALQRVLSARNREDANDGTGARCEGDVCQADVDASVTAASSALVAAAHDLHLVSLAHETSKRTVLLSQELRQAASAAVINERAALSLHIATNAAECQLLSQQCTSLAEQLTEVTTRLQHTVRVADELTTENCALQNDVREAAKRVAAFQDAAAASEQQEAALRGTLEANQVQVALLQDRVALYETQLSALRQTLATRDAHIAVLQEAAASSDAACGTLRESLQALQEAASAKDAHITALQQQLSDAEAEVRQRQNQAPENSAHAGVADEETLRAADALIAAAEAKERACVLEEKLVEVIDMCTLLVQEKRALEAQVLDAHTHVSHLEAVLRVASVVNSVSSSASPVAQRDSDRAYTRTARADAVSVTTLPVLLALPAPSPRCAPASAAIMSTPSPSMQLDAFTPVRNAFIPRRSSPRALSPKPYESAWSSSGGDANSDEETLTTAVRASELYEAMRAHLGDVGMHTRR